MTNPYETPESTSVSLNDPNTLLSEVYRNKKLAVFSESTVWPKRCIKCNKETDHSHQVKLTWVNPWAYISILFSLIVLIIVVLIVQKKFNLELPLCEEHQQKRKQSVMIRWASFLLFLSSLIAGLVLEIDPLIFLSIPLFFGWVIYAAMSNFVHIRKVKDGVIWMKGAENSFLESLREIV